MQCLWHDTYSWYVNFHIAKIALLATNNFAILLFDIEEKLFLFERSHLENKVFKEIIFVTLMHLFKNITFTMSNLFTALFILNYLGTIYRFSFASFRNSK